MCIQNAIRTNAATDVYPKRLDEIDGGSNVVRAQSTGKEDGDRNIIYDLPADLPVVHSACAAQFLDLQVRIPGNAVRSAL